MLFPNQLRESQMGIRFSATHLHCPTCGRTLSLGNPKKGEAACATCKKHSSRAQVSKGFFTRLHSPSEHGRPLKPPPTD